jgi:hypothetical protein
VEVPLARESKPRTNYQCHSHSCAVKTVSSRRLGMGRESHLYLLSFACQRAIFNYRSPYILREYMHMGGTPQFPRFWCLGWSARGPWVLHREGWISGFYLLGRVGVGMRCAEKAVNGLDQWMGPTPRKCGRECTPGFVARLWSLLEGRTSIECKKMWYVTPCFGKELRTRHERCSQGTNTLCWLLGIVFISKSNLSRNIDKILHWPMTLLGPWL